MGIQIVLIHLCTHVFIGTNHWQRTLRRAKPCVLKRYAHNDDIVPRSLGSTVMRMMAFAKVLYDISPTVCAGSASTLKEGIQIQFLLLSQKALPCSCLCSNMLRTCGGAHVAWLRHKPSCELKLDRV
eukprot:302161-Amphidinium_carterae.1